MTSKKLYGLSVPLCLSFFIYEMGIMRGTISWGCCKNVNTTQKTICRARRTTRTYAIRMAAVAVTVRVSVISSCSSIWASQHPGGGQSRAYSPLSKMRELETEAQKGEVRCPRRPSRRSERCSSQCEFQKAALLTQISPPSKTESSGI